uniref:Uncharacterized protein n=1 Tax=Micrurus lemniscatus lemniscatus TaxID=129467 RepID=A0A2D4HU50_MICLE
MPLFRTELRGVLEGEEVANASSPNTSLLSSPPPHSLSWCCNNTHHHLADNVQHRSTWKDNQGRWPKAIIACFFSGWGDTRLVGNSVGGKKAKTSLVVSRWAQDRAGKHLQIPGGGLSGQWLKESTWRTCSCAGPKISEHHY